VRVIAGFLVFVFVAACLSQTAPDNGAARQEKGPLPLPGLHNVYRITDKFFSGSSPDGEEGFRSLQKLGIKTILSVDGARPDVASARKFRMRYVHIPFGYDGIPRSQVLRLARAVRDLPGPVYIHCHHGKHRGPAAAAAIHLCLDKSCTVQQVLAEMRRAGTDSHYTGLYAVPPALVRPTAQELDQVPADFPETAAVPGLARLMANIDTRWENLKLIRAAQWRTPAAHPDLDPPHEALQLLEQYREAGRLKQVENRQAQFRRWLAEAEKNMTALEQQLRALKTSRRVDRTATERLYQAAGAACTRCHATYRDVPQKALEPRP
jgi:protein tyrosine phosphatase (PTP) superfamily phosphohydrolase (DUF442 family)